MKTVTAKDVFEALAKVEQEMGDPKIQPAVIIHRNVPAEDVEELWAGHFNEHWTEKINKKLAEGFVIFRIHTEWVEGSGHQTMIYLVKLKK